MSRSSPRTSPLSRRRRMARARAVHSEEEITRRDEGTGGPAGIVLPLNMVGGGMYEAVYTVAVQVGSNSQNFSLQVDAGSSDLWIASTSCSSTACGGTKGRQYDPSVSGNTTGSQFSIQYLAGEVSGPIYWDQVQLGGYTLNNQALAAATNVASEPLEHEFNGVLGLAPPSDSVIAHSITPVTGDSRDGAPFASNLFGITPASSAPSARFFSFALSRPGSSTVPSLLGIGRHPSELVPDPSKVKYTTVASQPQGTLFWEVSVRAITLYVNGSPHSINLSHPRSGNTYPTAVLDSGVPFILTSTNVANGIYGALGIGPAADGQYYVPCTKPLNMTITIDGQPEIPLHPLDVTTQSQTDPSSSTCVGLIQTGDGAMDSSTSVSDMILGVAFLRNVYTVMAYDQPDASGVFPNNSDSAINPQVGLLSLTNATHAMQEFHNVRILNQPLSGNSSSPTSGATNNKMSVGIDVLLALVGVIAACVTLFGLRWFLVRRQLHRKAHFDVVGPKRGGPSTTTYQLAHRASFSSVDLVPAHMSAGMSIAGNSTRTVVGQEDDATIDEFGFRRIKDKNKQDGDDTGRQVSYLNLDPGDPSGWCDTLVDSTIDFPDPEATAASSLKAAVALASDNEPISSSHEAALAAAAAAGLPMHRHTVSDIGGAGPDEANSLTEPLLLSHARDDSAGSFGALNRQSAVNASRGGGDDDDDDDDDLDDLAEFGVAGAGAVRESMAGIGTAARSSRIRATQHGMGGGSSGSLGSLSNASLVIGPGLRFPSIAPGERLSGYSIISEAAEFSAAIPHPTPPPPPPPPSSS
ncbi:aspartic peptidase domain-containing protein [Russula compacta]|nr:aspartic peptidase domain-containing protein [Russula compacta]